ncbi:hypothetical protein B0H13DRAFT_2338009 [Mycena leptocephala]|nr:hypothetical protein B0H13DRAFT_2338009 [Mycena leptocephala]
MQNTPATGDKPAVDACPILTLPPEIMRSIFSLYINSPHIGCMAMSERIGRGPLRIATVCKTWREICLSHPALWASFRVYAHEMYHSQIDAFIDFLRCWISRAQQLPLDISIHHPIQNFPDALGMWESFPNAELQGRLPNLETLSLVAGYKYDKSVKLTGFQDAPSLREVSLWGFNLDDIALPWTQITHLELEGNDFASVLEILEQTPQLTVFIVEFSEDMEDEPDLVHQPLDLDRLHTLRLSHVMDSRILRYLTVPALKTLEIGYTNAGTFLILLESSELPTGHCALESIPSLEALEIIYTRRTLDPLFERLRTDIAFLPNIREISIKWYPFPVSAEVLGGMIAVRRMGRLQSFHLFFENQATMAVSALEAIDTILRPLKAGGFEFAIGTQFPPLTASGRYYSVGGFRLVLGDLVDIDLKFHTSVVS